MIFKKEPERLLVPILTNQLIENHLALLHIIFNSNARTSFKQKKANAQKSLNSLSLSSCARSIEVFDAALTKQEAIEKIQQDFLALQKLTDKFEFLTGIKAFKFLTMWSCGFLNEKKIIDDHVQHNLSSYIQNFQNNPILLRILQLVINISSQIRDNNNFSEIFNNQLIRDFLIQNNAQVELNPFWWKDVNLKIKDEVLQANFRELIIQVASQIIDTQIEDRQSHVQNFSSNILLDTIYKNNDVDIVLIIQSVIENNLDIAKILQITDHDVKNIENKAGNNIFHIIALNNRFVTLVTYLLPQLERANINLDILINLITAKNNQDMSPIEIAAKHGLKGIAKQFFMILKTHDCPQSREAREAMLRISFENNQFTTFEELNKIYELESIDSQKLTDQLIKTIKDRLKDAKTTQDKAYIIFDLISETRFSCINEILSPSENLFTQDEIISIFTDIFQGENNDTPLIFNLCENSLVNFSRIIPILVNNLQSCNQDEIFHFKNNHNNNAYHFAKENGFFGNLFTNSTQNNPQEDIQSKIPILPQNDALNIGTNNFKGLFIFCCKSLNLDITKDFFSKFPAPNPGKQVLSAKIDKIDAQDKVILNNLYDRCFERHSAVSREEEGSLFL